MAGRILHDQKRRMRVGNVVVPPLADRNELEQIVSAVQGLAQLQQIGFALQLDADLAAHIARPAVAADALPRRLAPLSPRPWPNLIASSAI